MRAKPGRWPVWCLLLCVGFPLQAADEPQIVLEGVEGRLRDNVLAHLSLEDAPCTAPLARLRRQLPDLRRQAATGLNALGHYHGSISARFVRTEPDACWELRLTIEPGEPLTLREVRLDIDATAEDRRLFQPTLEESRLVAGRVLNHGEYEDLKSALSGQAADLGFLDARFEEARIALDLPQRQADVQLRFVPGQRYRFGAISVSRPGVLSEQLIERLLPVQTGDPYGAASLVALRSSLDRSQYFQQIRVTPQLRNLQGGVVPVQLDLQLRPRHAWTGGLGFTTDTGPRARLSYENRYVNSMGHRLSADTSLSDVRSNINGSYSIPVRHVLADQVQLSAGYIVESNEAFDSQRIQFGIALPSENRYGWQQTLGVDVQRDDYELASSDAVSWLVLPGISLGKTRADDLINPRHGWKLQGTLKGSSNSLLSDTTFLQFHGTSKLVQAFGRLRLLGRAEVGATWIDETLDLPASLRFFAGGDQSIRGYDFRSVAPQDAVDGTLVGGKQLAVASIELDYQLRDRWRVALFTDAGNAFNRFDDIRVRQSIGVGLRWLSPIGPLRVDLAHAPDAAESFRIHITMGPDL